MTSTNFVTNATNPCTTSTNPGVMGLNRQKTDGWRRQSDLSKITKDNKLLRGASQLFMIILNC